MSGLLSGQGGRDQVTDVVCLLLSLLPCHFGPSGGRGPGVGLCDSQGNLQICGEWGFGGQLLENRPYQWFSAALHMRIP